MATVNPLATILTKNGRDDARALYTDSTIPNTEDNLADWLVKLEIINTGVSKTNSGTITLRIDQAGTFIRDGPILVDQDSKNDFLIELQLQQDIDNDGDFSEADEQSIVLRGLIGQPQITINETYGEILTINLVGIEYRLKETLTSEEHLLQTPGESFGNRLEEVTVTSTGIRITSTTNNLPTSENLRQNFIPFNPTKVHDTMANVIDILSLPQVAGGTFIDYYFDLEPVSGFTNHLSIIADEFGSVDSGVVINPLSVNAFDTEEEQTVVTDNLEYKNHVIMVGSASGSSLPTERTRFASRLLHAQQRPTWNGSSISYTAGDLVQYKTTTTYKPHLVTYHRALINHTSSGGNDPLTSSGTLWEQDFSVTPEYVTASSAFYRQGEIVAVTSGGTVNLYQANTNGTHPTPASANWNHIVGFTEASYTAFISYTPWTTDVDVWKETLAGRGRATAGGDEGWAYDWNITKANYKREDLKNSFEPISVKWVTSVTKNNPPSFASRETFDSNRFLLAGGLATGDWAGEDDKIAEWDSNKEGGAGWQFSVAPSTTDMINDLDTAQIFAFAGGAWAVNWDGTDINDNDKPSPFHLCQNVGLVAGATQIPGQAVEFTYDWIVGLGEEKYRTSRGAWISSSFPFPRLDTSQFNAGELYGGNGTSLNIGTFGTHNLDHSRKGIIGWNQGVDVEDMGRVNAMKFKLRVSVYKDTAATNLSDGMPNIPMTFWCTDKFDRVWYFKFKLRRNGQWDTITIPIGELAQQQLYFARWDELALLNDVVLTELDFTLQEKEFSGVQFDWRFMKHWGIQMDESYTDVGLYKNGLQRAVDYGNNIGGQLASNPYWLFGPIISTLVNTFDPPIKADVLKSISKIAIDDLHFDKEQITTSDDSIIADPRTSVEQLPTESDYLNLKDRAIGKAARKKFFPQIWHIRSTGDVRLRFGQLFTVTNTRVPGSGAPGTQTMVCSEVKHIWDHDGYHVELAGVRKFTTSG